MNKTETNTKIKSDKNVENILKTIADMAGVPDGAYNIRVNGESIGRSSSENIEIKPKTDNPGIDIIVKPGTKGEMAHIPVVVDDSGLTDMVYNDFYIGEGADIEIVAGCGIHNDGTHLSQHDGIHTFHVGEKARVKYVEKHYGEGEGTGKKVLNPETIVNLEKDSYLEMETVQIEGVDNTNRMTKGKVADGATLVVKEKLMTSGNQTASTNFVVDLDGQESSADLISRSVAKGQSKQEFVSRIDGNNECMGHSECDAIIMDNAVVTAVPEITANHLDATLIHEAAIGKIAGEQLTKLMTLGLTEEEAEKEIINGFLR